MKIGFSIIVPIYNVEEYVVPCIKSILNQSGQNYEVILVNDGSKDNCASICDEFAQKHPDRIKVIHKKNGGLSDARNIGIKAAKGKYVIFLDGDDYFTCDFLFRLNTLLTLDIDVILGAGLICDFGVSQKEIIRNWKELKINSKLEHHSDRILMDLLNSSTFQWCAWLNIYRTKFLLENNLFFKVGITCEDAEWTPRVILKGTSFSITNQIYYGYRMNREGSIMQGLSYKRWFDFVSIAENWIGIANNWGNKDLAEKFTSIYINGCFNGLYEVARFKGKDRENAIRIVDKSQFIQSPCKKIDARIKKLIQVFGINQVLLFLKAWYILKKYKNGLRQILKKINDY